MNTPKIPIKKSKETMEFYLENGLKFGKILYILYSNLRNGMELYKLPQYFNAMCKNKFSTTISFPFNTVKNDNGDFFDRNICISINDEVAHGRHNIQELEDQITNKDIISLDFGICVNNYCFDAAFTIKPIEKKYSRGWEISPWLALKEIVKENPKNTLELSKIIREKAEDCFLNQVVSLTGHGIGQKLHEAPTIYNAPADFLPVDFFDGVCFCAEPIYTLPTKESDSFITPICIGEDGWKILTTNGNLSSHWETTYGVINDQIVDLIGVTNWDL